MKKSTEQTTDRLTDEELSAKLGGYQRAESIGMLLGVVLVIASCILAFVTRNLPLFAALFFAGVALVLLIALPAQKKKKALLHQQMGDFFRAELYRSFGAEPETPELPIDKAYLESVELLAIPWMECSVEDFHEGVHSGLRFSAANVELRRTVEERSGPNNDNWMTRSETLFHGIVVRCKDICVPALEFAVRDQFQERKKGESIADPTVFSRHFAICAADGRSADELVTPALRELVQKLENIADGAKLGALIFRDGTLVLALNTRYRFADTPEGLDLRDISGIRKWFTASLTSMGMLLDLLRKSPAMAG